MKAVWKGSASAKKGLAIIATKVFFSLVLSVVVLSRLSKVALLSP
jgi:hypothetical protein